MARKAPIIRDGILVVEQPAGHETVRIAVGSDAWFAWLDQASSFIFDDPVGSFSARKKPRGKNLYWYGVRRSQGDLREPYLGKSANLTLDRLRTVAAGLNPRPVGPSTPPVKPPPRKPPPRKRSRKRATGGPPMATLLPGKTSVPQIPLTRLVQTQAVTFLELATERRLTAIDAPAGYGKTTVLVQWLAASNLPVAWVWLDAGDNDMARFWRYVCAALDKIVPGLLQTLEPLIRVPHARLPDAIPAALIRGLSAAPDPTMLVFDDFHTLRADNVPLHQVIASLLEHLPPQVHLVLASREQLPLNLARLRERGQLLELHAADLQLTLAETTALLTQRYQLDLSTEQVAELHTRAEGWVVGLRLAALSLQKGSDSLQKGSDSLQKGSDSLQKGSDSLQKGSDIARRVAAFSGEHRSVADYLVEEVMLGLPPDVQSYLLRISVLDRLTAPLCDAITGWGIGQAMLAELERHHLFLVPLDDRREWFRFHALFADALRRHLRQTQPGSAPELYARASAWCEANGHTHEAIEYAFAGDDPGRAAQLLEAYVPMALERGYLALLREMIERLPDELVRDRPHLGVAHAYILITMGERALVPRRLQEAEEAIGRSAPTLDPTELALLRAEIMALRIDLQTTLGDRNPDTIIALCQHALGDLPSSHPLHRLVSAQLGINQLLDGDVRAASWTLDALMRASEGQSDVFYLCVGLLNFGVVKSLQGDLDDVLELCRRTTRQVAGYADASVGATIDLVMGRVLYERNDLDAALQHLRQSVSVRFERAVSLGEGFPALAYTYLAQGESVAARETIEQAFTEWERSLAESRRLWAWTGDLIRAHRARLYLLQGDVEPASRWARRLERTRGVDGDPRQERVPPTYLGEWERMVLARVYLAECRPRTALKLLKTLGAAADAAGRMARLIEILILQAVAYDELGDADAALHVLQRAVELAAPERFIRTFVDAGPAVFRLVSTLARKISLYSMAAIAPVASATQNVAGERGRDASLLEYLKALKTAFGLNEQSDGSAAIVGSTAPEIPVAEATLAQPLTEPLTPGERRVLRSLAQGASNLAIAAELVISPRTVKSHVHSILSKFGARNRTEAVVFAITHHLIDPFIGPEGAPSPA